MHPYTGSGPYCYANSLAMMLGPAAPSPSVIEVLTGSLQYDIVTGASESAAETLRQLAPTYDELAAVLTR